MSATTRVAAAVGSAASRGPNGLCIARSVAVGSLRSLGGVVPHNGGLGETRRGELCNDSAAQRPVVIVMQARSFSAKSGSGSGSSRGGPFHPPRERPPGGDRGAGRGGGGGRGAGAFSRFRKARGRDVVPPSTEWNPPPLRAPAPAQAVKAAAEAVEAKKKKVKFHRGGEKKKNFAKTVLEPAARGELAKGHSSGIPRLAARKTKGHTVHDHFPGETPDEIAEDALLGAQEVIAADVESDDDTDYDDDERIMAEPTPAQQVHAPAPSPRNTGGVRIQYAAAKQITQQDQDQQYDSEDSEAEDDEIDSWCEDVIDPDNHPYITKAEDGTYILDYDPNEQDDADEHYYGSEIPTDKQYRPRRDDIKLDIRGNVNRDVETGEVIPRDPDDDFFFPDILDFSAPVSTTPDHIANSLLPLRPHGPDLDDFLEADLEHPTKYAAIKRDNPHPESRREPKPDKPKHRLNPPVEFVTSYRRFLYVSGIRHPIIGGELGQFDNPLHRHEVAETIANMFGIKVTDVCPATMTSAFIGFQSHVERSRAKKTAGLQKRIISSPVRITPYDYQATHETSPPDETVEVEGYEEFINSSQPGCIVKLDNIPPGRTVTFITNRIFADEKDKFGQLSAKDILFTSPTMALVRLASSDLATAALASDKIRSRLVAAGRSVIQIFHAKRELEFDSWTGPNNCHEVKKKGDRLIVDGDVPTKDFFLSHAGVLHLRNLDPSVTKEQLSKFFQPFSTDYRDVYGSVEFVTCRDGLPTGKAYVGFDRLGEAQEAMKNLRARAKLGNGVAILRFVKDKHLRRGRRLDARPNRSEEELLDSLKNWEQYVDPADIEELEKLGIYKSVLDEIFTTVRYRNRTFGSVDQAMRGERLVSGRKIGQHYQDFVRLYIKVLKDIAPTREKPGLLFEAMHMPGEELDLSLYDQEMKRVAELREKGK